MTAAHARPLRCQHCAASAAQAAHHDRLLHVDVDPDELLALIELAVTWHELDYSDSDVLGPRDWLHFADRHTWTEPARAETAFSLAMDIVGRADVEPTPPQLTLVPR
jgi:hypothetical protein